MQSFRDNFLSDVKIYVGRSEEFIQVGLFPLVLIYFNKDLFKYIACLIYLYLLYIYSIFYNWGKGQIKVIVKHQFTKAMLAQIDQIYIKNLFEKCDQL